MLTSNRNSSMMARLKQSLSTDVFITSPISMSSPVYIVRQGLFKLINELAPKVNGDILDFGCGSKPYESLFTNSESYVGIDIEESGHNHINSKVDFYWDGKVLPFKDSTFDAIVSFEVFEHIFNIDEVLSELWRVLKPDGQLLLSVPFVWNEHEIPYDFARYTSFGLAHALGKSNFQVVDQRKTTTFFLTIGQQWISYLSQHLLPKGSFLGTLSRFFLVLPMTIFFVAMNSILPKNYDLFCNSVVLCCKESLDKVNG